MAEIERISGYTKLVGLIGSPVAHSMSPATHNLSFEHLGLDVAYMAFDVKQDTLEYVIRAFKNMGGVAGTNVTMPCKKAVIPYLDELSDAARLMGAVNVVKFEDGKAIGHNTDGMGFMTNLRKNGLETVGSRMTLIGPGGAGSAIIVQAALDGVAHIDVFARENGPSYNASCNLLPRVKEETGCELVLHAFENKDEMRECIDASDILINASSVGMGHNCTDTPVSADFLRSDLNVADTVYLSRETQLILNAKKLGCRVCPGIGMMVEQAAAGEKIWFGVDMPIDLIQKTLFSDED